MILTLHLTENCNMDCSYCFRCKKPKDMTMEVLKASCDRIFADGNPAGFSFFGGEPLLKKDLITYALDYCNNKSKETKIPFHTKMTTNGVLLDDEFLSHAKKQGLKIAISFEGTEQNTCRHLVSGEDSFELVSKKAKLLLSYMPDSYAMMTIAPEAVDGVYEAVKYIYELGFRRITFTIAYGQRVHWTEPDFERLAVALDQVSEFYQECFLKKDSFFFSPFDSKIYDLIHQKLSGARCHLGRRQMSVAVDGNIYPCTQFLDDPDYYMGNVFEGLDEKLWTGIIQRSMNRKEPADCRECAIRHRCLHTCGCANRMETGNEADVSPTQCAYERLIIEKSDVIADKLLSTNQEAFLKKFNVKLDF